MDETTMVVQGQVTLHKVPDIVEYNCSGCFFINSLCPDGTCYSEKYIWEVLEWHL